MCLGLGAAPFPECWSDGLGAVVLGLPEPDALRICASACCVEVLEPPL